MIPTEILKKASNIKAYLGMESIDKENLKKLIVATKELTDLILIKYCFESDINQSSLITMT